MRAQKEKIWRAGVVPYYINENEVFMMFMKPTLHPDKPYMLDKDKFQIAKGRIDDSDASTQDAALRESKEELGLWEGNILNIFEAGTFLGRTTIYLAEIEDKNLFAKPDAEETAETKWMTVEEFWESGRELHRTVVGSLDNIIRTHHGMIEEETIEETDDDEFENPLALDKWGRKVNYESRRRRR